MPTKVLLVQVLVLVFTAALWWIARRDLAARVPPPVPPAPAADTSELEELCATLETLVTRLAQRVDAVEAAASKNGMAAETAETVPSRRTESDTVIHAEPVHAEPAPDPRYAPVYALLDAGIFDPVEIARRTGLGRGEVDLILSLRDRHAR